MKVLFDTNVLIAAFLTEGLCQKLLIRANRKEFLLYTSPYILEELKRSLSGKLAFTRDEVREATNLVTEIARLVDHKGTAIRGICRDKKDDPILASALASGVDCLVTGDSDLLSLKRYKGVKILSPREFEMLLVQGI